MTIIATTPVPPASRLDTATTGEYPQVVKIRDAYWNGYADAIRDTYGVDADRERALGGPVSAPTGQTRQRAPQPGETCSCGRPAVVVYLTENFGPVGYCGIPGAPPLRPGDGGAK